MGKRVTLEQGCYYHVFTKSIAGFQIFMSKGEYSRILNTVRYYQMNKAPFSLSRFVQLKGANELEMSRFLSVAREDTVKLVEIAAYCFMPTHMHFILKQLIENGISDFMRLTLNSYTHYFNIKHKRKGPLWQGRFKNVLVESDEQLSHLTRYIHLNPVTAGMVEKPEQWDYSSYAEYIGRRDNVLRICDFKEILDMRPEQYTEFVYDQIDYQKELGRIKNFILE